MSHSSAFDLVKKLAKSDGTTSTNYGTLFELYSLTLCLLNCCKQKKKAKIWANKTIYGPWDDLVIEIDDQIICVQLKHRKEFNQKQFEDDLKERQEVIKNNQLEDASVIFVYFSVSSIKKVLLSYSKVEENLDVLSFMLTNNKFVFHDKNFEKPSYFCMKQHTIIGVESCIRNALREYIAIQDMPKDFLKTIQVLLVQYIHDRYQRLIKQNEPLTSEELSEQLGYILLSKFKIPYTPSTNNPTSNNLSEIFSKSDIIVLDHRISSILNNELWDHLLHALNKNSKKLKQEQIDALWISGKIHMPLFSPDYFSDRKIVRALHLLSFKPKVLILRPRMFHIRKEQKVHTILQNIVIEMEPIFFTSQNNTENFKYAMIKLDDVKSTRLFHQDLFCKLAKKYTNTCVIEVHDEFNYVNDGGQSDTPLIASIKIPEINISVIKHLINLGANVNAAIVGGYGPLYFSYKVNRLDIMELLLQNNANPDAADKDGNATILYAIKEEKSEVVNLLIKHNANRSAADFFGVSLLFWAYNMKNFEIMAMLLKGFDKAAAANVAGSHILHKAAEDNNVHCLECVILNCLNINMFMTGDVKGKTPLEIALELGHEEFANMLKNVIN